MLAEWTESHPETDWITARSNRKQEQSLFIPTPIDTDDGQSCCLSLFLFCIALVVLALVCI